MKTSILSDRACEICGHNDSATRVLASSYGPVSFNYCDCCNIVGADMKTFLKLTPNLVWYNPTDDKYYSNGKPISSVFTLASGVKVDLPTRKDIVEFINNNLKE